MKRTVTLTVTVIGAVLIVVLLAFVNAPGSTDDTLANNDEESGLLVYAPMAYTCDGGFLVDNEDENAEEATWLTEGERVFGLSFVWKSVAEMSPFISAAPDGFDWDALFLEYIPKVIDATDMLEYYEILSRFLAHLADGKSNIQSPADLYVFPIEIMYVENNFIVFAASPYHSNIPLGSTVLYVNGMTARDFLETNFGFRDGRHTPLAREYILASNFTFTRNPIMRAGIVLEALTPQGETVQETIYFEPFSDEIIWAMAEMQENSLSVNQFWGIEPIPLETGATAFVHDGDIHHITISTFANPALPEAVRQYIEDVADTAQAFILDIRGNGGGTSDWVILSQFADIREIPLGYSYRQMRDGALMGVANMAVMAEAMGIQLPDDIWNLAMHGRSLQQGIEMLESRYLEALYEFEGIELFDRDIVYEQSLRLFDTPVVVLANYMSGSAAESFVVAARAIDTFTVIGTNTTGMAGDITTLPLPGGGLLSLNVVKQMTPERQIINNHGVSPDIWVEQSLADLLEGIDTQLVAAIEYLGY
ncbi:MAG: S41 family peptidase [Defluviitaleaceae bacterium]|nr:S41 family peptidase [Defluviitaleaceae bacterium]